MRFARLFKILVLIFVASSVVKAQDIHFSQFYLSPLTLNPALTGVSNCDVRFVANYRNQWASVIKANAYNTFQLSYDQKFPSGRYDNFGLGISLMGDRAGESSFSTLQGKLLLSYQRYMGGDRTRSNYLSAGAEVGGFQRSLDFLALRFGNQVDWEQPDNFGGNIPSNESIGNDKVFRGDVGAGLVWYSVWSDIGNSFYAGVAAAHLNSPKIEFLVNDNGSNVTQEGVQIYTKFTGHAGAELMINNKFGVVPNLLYLKQGPSQEINAGLAGKFLIERSRYAYKTFQVGLWGRASNHFQESTTMDALIAQARFDYNEFTLGFSYDINVSPLRPASNTAGALEFALQYKICEGRKRAQGCPDNF